MAINLDFHHVMHEKYNKMLNVKLNTGTGKEMNFLMKIDELKILFRR
jgi:hypothetical protein